MPNARIIRKKVGDIWERGRALLAWKLGNKGMVVDVVAVLSNVGGGSDGVYRRIKGENQLIHNNNSNTNTRHGKRNVGGVLTQY